MSICERLAQTINKHLAFDGRNLSKLKSGFHMSFGDKAEQRTYIMFCVELGKSPMEIKPTTGKET